MKTRLQAPLLFAIGAFVTLPATQASAAPVASFAPKGKVATPKAKHNKRAANRLCREVKVSKRFKTLAMDEGATSMADGICRFYAIAPASKQKYWDAVLGQLVRSGKLTRRDGRSLSRLLVDPSKTIESWNPDTAFGRAVLDHLPDDKDDDVTANSTAGDVGTIAGAMLGGLGGSPASVALGAALGKLAGEAANVLGQAAYDLAPDNGEGGDDGGEEDGDGGGDAGGDK